MPPPTTPLAPRSDRRILAVWIAYWIALVAATHLPGQQVRRFGLGVSDWLLHTTAYAGLAALTWLAVGHRSRSSGWRWMGVLIAFGALDEITQPLVGRSAQLGDWLADAAGVLGVATVWTGVCWAVRKRHARRR